MKSLYGEYLSFVWRLCTGGRSFFLIYSGAAFHCNLSACCCATRLFERTGEGDPRSSAKDRLQSRVQSESVATKDGKAHRDILFKWGFVPKDIRRNTHFTMDLTYF